MLTEKRPEGTDDRVAGRVLAQIPPFPPAARKLLTLVSGDTPAIHALTDVLMSDTALGAEVLCRANSALYGHTSSVASLHRAVSLIGFDEIRSMALALSMGSILKPVMKFQSLRQCWRHSVVCALVSEELGSGAACESGHAYTAGLLHDVGLLGMMAIHSHEYDALLSEEAETALDLCAVEKRLFGVDHCETGGWLVRRWDLPEDIAIVCERHRDQPISSEKGVLP
ncbi:MAG: HDOD domain-containing protein, partial [Bryobacteraceae bacterium]